MKTLKLIRSIVRSITLLAALMLIPAACSNELTDSDRTPEKQPGEASRLITVTATQGAATQTDGPQTRLSYDFTPADGSVGVTWATGDKFYMAKNWTTKGPVSAENNGFKPFTLEGDGGSKNGTFTGELPADVTTDGDQLYAVYGKDGSVTGIIEDDYESVNGIMFDYTTQTQAANDDKSHLTDYDFMAATTKYKTGETTPNFAFAHLGAMIKFTLTLPMNNLTVKQLELATTDGSKPFSQSMLWTKEKTPQLKPNYTVSYAMIGLGADENGLSMGSDNAVLTAYMMMAPTTLTKAEHPIAGKTLKLQVTDADGVVYSTTLTGADIEQGRYYTVTATLSPFDGGDGTEKNPYQINNAGQLRNLATLVNSGADYEYDYYKLTADIDLKNEEWTPIGTSNTRPFNGSFTGAKPDGGNYEIKGLSITNPTDDSSIGLFGYIYSTKTHAVSNVTVSGNIKFSNTELRSIGGIVGQLTGSLNNCISNCTIDVTNTAENKSESHAGGIVGYNYGGNITLTACQNTGSVSLVKSGGSSSKLYVGGIIGYVNMNYLEAKNVIINGFTHTTGVPAAVIGQYNFKADNTTVSIKIRETQDTGDYTIINSGKDSYTPPTNINGGGPGDYEDGGNL